MEGDTRRCRALRKDGSPCRVRAVLPSGYCVMHDPERAAELAGIRAAGGKAKSNQARAAKALPASLQDVSALILRSLSAVEQEEMKPGQATAIAALASVFVKLHETAEQDQRISDLEARINTSRRGA